MLFLSALVPAVREGVLPFEDDNTPADSPTGANGSPISCDGDNTGDEFAAAKFVLLGTLRDACRPTLFDEGDARRESVFRKVDLRFGGDGNVDTSIGSLGSLVDPSESASLA